MSRRNDREVQEAYKNLEKLGPWGEESIIYSLFTTDEGFKKAKQFKSAEISPRKTFSKELMPQSLHSTLHTAPQRVFTGRPSQRNPNQELPRTNVEEYFNRKPDKRTATTSKKLFTARSSSKSLPMLNVKRELEIQRKVFLMLNQKGKGRAVTTRRESRSTVPQADEPPQTSEASMGQTDRTGRPGFRKHLGKMLKIIDSFNRDEQLWIERPRNTHT